MLNKYSVLIDDVQIPGMEGIVKGAVVELDAEGDVTKELLAAGSIALVPAVEDLPLTQADFDADPDLIIAGFKVGDERPEADAMTYYTLTQADMDAHSDLLAGKKAGDTVNLPKDHPLVVAAAEAAEAAQKAEAIVEPAATTEKKKYYRKQEVLIDGMREVEGREHHHITLADGSEMDLSDEEYTAEIYLA